jgi:hypothetical protein
VAAPDGAHVTSVQAQLAPPTRGDTGPRRLRGL